MGYNSWGHKELDLTDHAHTYLKGLTDHVLFFIKRVMGASKAETQTMLDLNGKPQEGSKQLSDPVTTVFSERSCWASLEAHW